MLGGLRTPTQPTFTHDPILGALPSMWVNSYPVDGDAEPFLSAPLGAIYCRKVSATAKPIYYEKRANAGRNDDWGALGGAFIIQQRVTRAQFTDGGSAAGTLDLTDKIPVGAFVEQVILRDVTGFTGNTSATITIGDGTDPDRYNTGTPSVFTTAAAIDVGVPSGTKIHVAEATVRLTVTGDSDFTAITAGAMTVCIYGKF